MATINPSAVLTLLLSLRCGTGFEWETCGFDEVLMKCTSDQMVFMERASLGRFNDSGCYNLTTGEKECFDDIRRPLQTHFPRHDSISFRISDEFARGIYPKCLKNLPSLKYTYQCHTVIASETCNGEEFRAKCEEPERIEIESALFGRMKSSRCIDFDEHYLNCSVDVQWMLQRHCNGRSECRFTVYVDRFNESSCYRSFNQYLEVSYKCIGSDANGSTEDPSSSSSSSSSSIPAMYLMFLVFIGPTAILLLSIVVVCCLIHRIRRRSKAFSVEYSDYPESNLRRQQVVNRCQKRLQADDEYTGYSEYEDYSEIRQ